MEEQIVKVLPALDLEHAARKVADAHWKWVDEGGEHRGYPHPRPHWIYFLQGDDGGPVKIGITRNDPVRRLEHLQAGYPFATLRLVALLPGTYSDERALHQRFAKSALRHEWFALSQELLECIARLNEEVP